MKITTREKAIKILNEWVEITKSSEDYNKDEGFLYTDIGTITYGDIEEAIKTLEQEPKTGWISVTDKLPEEYIACLCTIRNHETFNNCLEVYNHVIQYDPDSKEWIDEDMTELDYEVIAWMPLLEPYKAESE